MLLLRFPLEAFGTNVHVLAAAAPGPCVVVDPGIGSEQVLPGLLAEHGLEIEAVLLTHGHVDHVLGLSGIPDVPVYIHPDDRYRLEDPVSGIGPQLAAMLRPQLDAMGTRWTPPSSERVNDLADGQTVTHAGLTFAVTHAPGHTEGSVLLTVTDLPDQLKDQPGLSQTVLTGDVLFAGSIGRTDLAGSDPAAMERTLRDVVPALPDDSLLFPGHGPATTMVQERAGNPFLG